MQKVVDEQDVGKRLDLVLKFYLPGLSRSAVRKLLDQGMVKVNGAVEYRPNYSVGLGDKIAAEDAADLSREELKEYKLKVSIAYQDDNIVIAQKPAGLKVHPSKTDETETLINALYYNLKDSLNDYGVTLINRIDKPTSGLVMAAVSPRGAWYYANQFKTNTVKKEYLAVVYGNWVSKFNDEVVDIHNFLERDSLQRKQVVNKESGTFAHTTFRAVAYNSEYNFTLLLVKPITGRTHQIRVHLEWLGFPILGDKKYSGREYKRLMLHSHRLRLQGMEGGDLNVESDIPEEFNELFSESDFV